MALYEGKSLNSLYKSQWRGALSFSLICDFRSLRAHYNVTEIDGVNSQIDEFFIAIIIAINSVKQDPMNYPWHIIMVYIT